MPPSGRPGLVMCSIEGVLVDAQLSFAFDSPSGRILVLLLATQNTDMDLYSTYRDTLAAIGWIEHDGKFVKSDELLSLEKIDVDGKHSWRLTIIPLSVNRLEIR